MKELIFCVGVIASFIICFIIGNFIYRLDNKKNFNILNSFPFEMISKRNNFNLLFRILLAIFISLSCIDILYLFIYHFDSDFLSRFIGIVLILEALMLLGLFLVSSILYKGHILISSLFFVLNIISFILIGYKGIVEKGELWISIIAFIVSFIELIIIFLPQLKNWYKLEINDEQYIKPKFNLYVFFEWINIITFIVSLTLYTINYL